MIWMERRGAELPSHLKEAAGPARIIPVRSKRLVAGYLEDVLTATAQRYGDFCLLIYGSPDQALLQSATNSFKTVARPWCRSSAGPCQLPGTGGLF